jgi:hypothetical protein
MNKSRVMIGGAAVLALSAAVPAAAAPSGLLNKTITVSFTASGIATSSSGVTHGFSTQVSRIIYVSSNGRLFMRHRASNQKGRSRGGDFAPDDTQQGKGSFNFQGDRLVGVIPYANGARQMSISFDSGFSGCTASVIEGRSNGTIRRKGPSGEMQEITSATTSTPSCSITAGNAFAN